MDTHLESELNNPAPSQRPRLTPLALLARNATLSLLASGWILLVLVVALPKLISYLGETAFGLFSLAWAVIGYLALLDIGVNRAATKFVSERLARQDHRAATQLVRTAVILNLSIGLLGGLVVAVITPYLIHSLFKIPGGLEAQACIAFYAVSASVPALLVNGVFRAVLSSYQMFGWINAIDGSANTAQWTIACLLAWKAFGVGWVVSSTVLVRLVAAGAYACRVHRVFPDLQLLRVRELREASKLLRFGGWVSVSQLVNPLLSYLDRILIASLVSLGAVTLYSVPFEAMSRLRILPSSLMAALYPAFSEREIDRQQLQQLYECSLRYLLILLGPGTLFLCVMGPDLFGLWMGESFARHTSVVVRMLALGVLANALAPVPYGLLQALGRPDLTGKFHLLELPLQFGLCMLLIPRWGINGAALATALRLTADSALLFWAAAKYCGCSFGISNGYARALTPSALLGLALSVARFALKSPGERLAAGALAVTACLLCAWFFALDTKEKPRITRAFRTLLGEAAS
ncbi:MAG TPA: flippase [Terriglobales bacterium]|nr:flippase [Terriglobales bacterium]